MHDDCNCSRYVPWRVFRALLNSSVPRTVYIVRHVLKGGTETVAVASARGRGNCRGLEHGQRPPCIWRRGLLLSGKRNNDRVTKGT